MKTLFIFSLFIFFFSVRATLWPHDTQRKPYIVYMGELPDDPTISAVDEHHNILTEALGDEELAREYRIHSYRRSFSGFVARLLPREARRLSEKDKVVSVFRNTEMKLLTTRSWDFLGMSTKANRNPKAESDLIVGLLDTGVWVESPSFKDDGYGPPPAKWKGKCQKGLNFTGCNRKVIGAQYFNVEGFAPEDQESPADFDGHGSHIASIAAGRMVEGASLYGIAEGTARGGVPSARIASYKVCWGQGCQDMDVLAGFDAAIADGVDVISISVGGHPRSFFQDPIAIGSYHAMKKKIVTTAAAGNEGPYFGTIQNVSPWLMTVAATSIDRRFESDVKLGNGELISGFSINTFELGKMYPLISGTLAQDKNATYPGNYSACDYLSISEKLVRGKIVYCLSSASQDYTIKWIHGVGVIASDKLPDTVLPTMIPATIVDIEDGKKIDKYINTTKAPTAEIFRSRAVKTTAPFVPSFSARGPQTISLNILKPDLAAPGLSILAAYTALATMTGQVDDTRVVKYNVESGTSMATPHAAGAAAYVKTFHPDWSPAAIKSALMTTAKAMKIKPIGAYLASGAGLIRPTKAVAPGLIFDINKSEYMSYLCKEFNNASLGSLTGSKDNKCKNIPAAQGADGLNYPSMHLQLTNPNATTFSAAFYRTVTYVGTGSTVFKAKIKAPTGLTVSVVPNILSFPQTNQKRSYKVVVSGKFQKAISWYMSGSLVWKDNTHSVRSPILVYRSLQTD
ncbi:PREDICTED: subtilisin-like protease SBT4.15 [Ipomoea nil]|uniref:subtilisin-like protease SBT4.15 n=1 Tax=Ipomoea nil TaxID=35883 RepID=UPI0009016668|nr:PREDICTED: subtilisin-like protease SBT4.15 [Ipomoea nil]